MPSVDQESSEQRLRRSFLDASAYAAQCIDCAPFSSFEKSHWKKCHELPRERFRVSSKLPPEGMRPYSRGGSIFFRLYHDAAKYNRLNGGHLAKGLATSLGH